MDNVKEWLYKYRIIIFLFLFSFLIRLTVILLIDTPIISDFKTMFEASLELINGTDSYKTMPYFITWGYQMGHVIYQAILLNLINTVTFLKIINILVTSLTVIMIYLIGVELSDKKSSFIISMIYSIFPFPLLLNTVLTNQLLPMLLILIAIYCWMKEKKARKSTPIIIGIILGISNILRSETIVIMIAFTLYIIFLLMKKQEKKLLITNLCLVIISYFIVTTSSSFLLKATNISPSGLENNNTAWKFLEGLNVDTRGQYSEEDAAKYAYNETKTKQELVQRIKQDWSKYPILFAKKVKILWLNSDLSWSLGHIENKDQLKLYEAINQIFIYFFSITSLLSVITLLKKNYKNEQMMILSILFIYFGVYLFIEIMPRYAYSLQIFEAILSTVTLGYILRPSKNNKEGDFSATITK